MTDNERFLSAWRRVALEEELSSGIGTLAERSMHKLLKLYYEPQEKYHEVEFLGSVADIMRDGRITEIQTGALSALSRKLERFLPVCPVTVVHPIIEGKTLCTVSKDGRVTRRKSPARGNIYSVAFELYKLRGLLLSNNLTVKLVFLDCDEYRRQGTGRRRGEKLNTVPRSINSELVLREKCDYLAFLPDGLPREFTADVFLRAVKSRSRYDYYALRLLVYLGILSREKSEGRAYIYKRIDTPQEM
ncbi:MAG: hypothetical protein IJW48_04715 [Clostridia bacterium]|nr:hypothetical protein [Clostridia bacterium]